jgi:hypothetical protein
MKSQRSILTALLAAAVMPAAYAVSPLITDDADTVPHGEFEWVITIEHMRLGGGDRENPLLFTLTYGIHPQIEVGVESGWIWNQDDNSVADTVLAAKWKHTTEEDPAMLFALGFASKLGTASRGKGLGSGDPDYSLIGIMTLQAGADTEIDFNIGYTSIGDLKLSREKDQVFLGIGARHPITETFTAVGEFVVDTPANTLSGSGMFPRLGFQWEFNDAMFLDVIGYQGVGTTSDVRGLATAVRFEF